MRSYSETIDYMANLRGGEIDLRLQRVERALALFDDPQKRYGAFHIAGTNGKGSTAAMLHRILSSQGYRTGLYTSPHLVSFTERIRVAQDEITPDEVVELAEEVQTRTAEDGLHLTFFEFVTVMGLVYFARQEVDVAVVEVGLGGRLDATNVVLPVVSLITTISKDHEAYLGNDLLSIAREKGGIIKPAVPVVCGSLPEEARRCYRDLAASHQSSIYFLDHHFSSVASGAQSLNYRGLKWDFKGLRLRLPGNYQKRNAAVALAALEAAESRFPVTEAAVREGLEKVFWPGRLETVARRPRVILDGAHNDEGVAALLEEMRVLLGGEKVRLLFGAMQDKNWKHMLQHLSTIAREVVLTRVPMQRSADPAHLAGAVPAEIPCKIFEHPGEALCFLLDEAEAEEVILVTGSLYLLGEVRPYFTREKGIETQLATLRS